MKHKNKIYLKTQENEYIKDFCLDIQNISINDINNIENKPLIINKHLFGNSKIIVYLKIQVNKGKYLNFLKYGIGNTYFCELNSIKNNYCNLYVYCYTTELINNISNNIIFKKTFSDDVGTITIKISKNPKTPTKVKNKEKSIIQSSKRVNDNFVSLSYVPNHKSKGKANIYHPFQGGSFSPK